LKVDEAFKSLIYVFLQYLRILSIKFAYSFFKYCIVSQKNVFTFYLTHKWLQECVQIISLRLKKKKKYVRINNTNSNACFRLALIILLRIDQSQYDCLLFKEILEILFSFNAIKNDHEYSLLVYKTYNALNIYKSGQ
jgi:hypothetical protein